MVMSQAAAMQYLNLSNNQFSRSPTLIASIQRHPAAGDAPTRSGCYESLLRVACSYVRQIDNFYLLTSPFIPSRSDGLLGVRGFAFDSSIISHIDISILLLDAGIHSIELCLKEGSAPRKGRIRNSWRSSRKSYLLSANQLDGLLVCKSAWVSRL